MEGNGVVRKPTKRENVQLVKYMVYPFKSLSLLSCTPLSISKSGWGMLKLLEPSIRERKKPISLSIYPIRPLALHDPKLKKERSLCRNE
jgi:hypothetical protein